MAAGEAMLVLIAVAVEPSAMNALRSACSIQGWLSLVLFSSLVANTVYMRLLRDWSGLAG